MSFFSPRHTSQISFSGVLVAAAFSICVVCPASAQQNDQSGNVEASDDAPVKRKVIHEPIHRVPNVPKVASNTAVMVNPIAIRSENVPNTNKPDPTTKTPAMLPSAAKPVAEPTNANAEPADPAPKTTVPVKPASSVKPVPHPLDDALAMARRGLDHIQNNVRDYSAIMVKRERVNGELLKPEYMQIKIRSERTDEAGNLTPLSIYMKFIKPRACAGREVIWVKGRNNNQLCVHEGSGLVSLKRFNLEPNSWIAMKGQRYPIYEAGVENLVVKLIEKAERDKAAGFCDVEYSDGVKINGRECSVIKVTHPEKRDPYDFYIAKVYIDKELKMPIRYQALLWPEPGSTKPKLLEEYTYLNVKVNQGFTDEDFNPDNPLYKYPKR